MALSADDWSEVAELVNGKAKDFKPKMTTVQMRSMAYKYAMQRGNPGPEYDDFERACWDYGWAPLDRHTWNQLKSGKPH